MLDLDAYNTCREILIYSYASFIIVWAKSRIKQHQLTTAVSGHARAL